MCKNKIDFVEYDMKFLEKSWCWLNDPEIKELTLTPSFTKEQQLSFFESLPRRKDYKIWGVLYNDERIGVVGLKNISEYTAEYFGYIGEKRHWNKGLSSDVFQKLFGLAKKHKLKELFLFVSSNNPRAIKAYKKNGFKIEESRSINNNLYMKVEIN